MQRWRSELVAAAEAEEAHLPHVYIFGGGHVGQALASAVALLPVHAVVIETRAEALEGMPETVETRLTPMPEAMVREAPAGTAFAILTHDHALDFLIVAEALKRDDTAYVGMIGSKTKKATFRNWFLKIGGRQRGGIRPPRLADRRRCRQGQAPAGHRGARGRRDHDGAGRSHSRVKCRPSGATRQGDGRLSSSAAASQLLIAFFGSQITWEGVSCAPWQHEVEDRWTY